jgi:uncharacterized membrane protein YgcG
VLITAGSITRPSSTHKMIKTMAMLAACAATIASANGLGIESRTYGSIYSGSFHTRQRELMQAGSGGTTVNNNAKTVVDNYHYAPEPPEVPWSEIRNQYQESESGGGGGGGDSGNGGNSGGDGSNSGDSGGNS